MAKKRKKTHREILFFWETEIMNRNLGISEYGKEAFGFVDAILRSYARTEQQEADAKREAVESPVLEEKGQNGANTTQDISDDSGAI